MLCQPLAEQCGLSRAGRTVKTVQIQECGHRSVTFGIGIGTESTGLQAFNSCLHPTIVVQLQPAPAGCFRIDGEIGAVWLELDAG